MNMDQDFIQARQDFLSNLRYTRGHSQGTCYAYNSDLGIWGRWLNEAGHNWRQSSHVEVEQFVIWHMREKMVTPHIVARRISCLSSFYKWAMKNGMVETDPVYLADKPKLPQRIPVWLEKDEQSRLQNAIHNTYGLPDNIFGKSNEYLISVRKRYDFLFGLIQNSGLRISEALGVKVRDVRMDNRVARSVRVIGKGDKERIVPLPAAFGQVFGAWIEGRAGEGYVFAKESGGKPPGPHAVRAYLRRLVEKAGIDKPVTPHKLRHTYATRLLESGAELVDIQALLGHVNLATTQIYTHVSDERMADVVSKL